MKSNFPNAPRVLSGLSSTHQLSPDCDCACASALNPVIFGESISSFLYHQGSAVQIAHKNSWQIYHNWYGPAAVVVLNSSARKLWHEFPKSASIPDSGPSVTEAVTALIRTGMLRLNEASILSPTSPNRLVAWIHMTGYCNLSCAYCYIRKSADPAPQRLYQVIDSVMRSVVTHNFADIHLKYSGGEPLLRFPVMMETHYYAQIQASRLGINLDGVVLSNGTLLTPTMVAQLRAANLRLMISLDGLGEVHDSQRHYLNGYGSFADVARALDLAQQGGLEPLISITITGRNALHLPELVSWLLERNLPISLNLYRENDCSMAEPELRLDEERIITGMLEAYKVIEKNLPRRSLLGALTDRASFVAPHCRTCSVGQNYLVFDSQGRVSKCQMDMAHPVTDINDPDPLRTIRASMTGLQNLSVDEKDECRDCEWRYWCGGGCPLMTHRATGSYSAKSPYCNIYKAIFPEALRLEGLRLIKYADALD